MAIIKTDNFDPGVSDQTLDNHTSDTGGGWQGNADIVFTAYAATDQVQRNTSGIATVIGDEANTDADYYVEVQGTLGGVTTNDRIGCIARSNGDSTQAFNTSTFYVFRMDGDSGWKFYRTESGAIQTDGFDPDLVPIADDNYISNKGIDTDDPIKMRMTVTGTVDPQIILEIDQNIDGGGFGGYVVVAAFCDHDSNHITSVGDPGLYMRDTNSAITYMQAETTTVPWQFLGEERGNYDTTVGVHNVSFTNLNLQEGDLVVIAQSADSNLNTLGLDRTQGYTIAYAPNDTSPGRLLAYKVMGATPDTSVNFNDGSAYHTYSITAWRGVDTSTPLDVSMPTEATGASANPDSPQVTPVTANALVLSVAHMDDDDTTVTTAPAGYSWTSQSNTGQASSTAGATVALAAKVWSSGAENPGQWTMGTSDAWAANTIAFRPFVEVPTQMVVSVERVTIDWDATSEPVTQNLSKSQTYTKCVPFFTKRLVSGSLTDDWRERTMKVEMIDNAGTPAVRVTASGKSSANDHRIEVYVVEFSSDITVQQVDADIADTSSSNNITIADVTAQANAFFMYSYQYTHGSAQDRADYGCVRPIWNGASTTSVTVERTGTVGTIDGMLYVVSCANSEFSVQHRDISVVATDELTNDTISAVPTATSFLLTHFRSSEAEDDPLDWSFVADLSSTTNVRVRRSIAGASNAAGNVGVQVVTCSGGQWDVQRGDFTTTSNLTATTTFSAVDLTRSFVKTGTHEAGLNSLGTSDLAAGTIVDEVGPSAYLSANNTITWTRESVSETGNTIPWEVIQFSAGLGSFIHIPTGPLR
jgi:hypothetical protein